LKYLDKIVHVGIYFLQVFLILFESKTPYSKGLAIKALAYCFLIGILTELGQKYFLLGRSFEIWDIVANIIGSIIGIYFFRILKPLL
jgi:VanZ family protein